jgi:periplasmic divalent cation tolerance protein
VLPSVTSIFRWKGEVERNDEVLMIIKTNRQRFEALRDAILSMHTYEVPEVIAFEIAAGHGPYLTWLDAAVGD